jgi:hypothetical protein
MSLSQARAKNMSAPQLQRLMDELDSEKVLLFCGKHNYAAKLLKAPSNQNCQECWQAYITCIVAVQAPHERLKFMEALQEFAHEVVQNPGEYKPYLHPEVTIEKDAIPD